MTALIERTDGRAVLVDDADFSLLTQFSWHACGPDGAYSGTFDGSGRGRKHILMHRLILSAPPELDVDHINGDPLDNRRGNLRLGTSSQNMQNRSWLTSSRTGFRNVYFYPTKKKAYRVRMTIDGNIRSYGYYRTLEEAHRAASAIRAKLMPFSPDAREQEADLRNGGDESTSIEVSDSRPIASQKSSRRGVRSTTTAKETIQ